MSQFVTLYIGRNTNDTAFFTVTAYNGISEALLRDEDPTLKEMCEFSSGSDASSYVARFISAVINNV